MRTKRPIKNQKHILYMCLRIRQPSMAWEAPFYQKSQNRCTLVYMHPSPSPGWADFSIMECMPERGHCNLVYTMSLVYPPLLLHTVLWGYCVQSTQVFHTKKLHSTEVLSPKALSTKALLSKALHLMLFQFQYSSTLDTPVSAHTLS